VSSKFYVRRIRVTQRRNSTSLTTETRTSTDACGSPVSCTPCSSAPYCQAETEVIGAAEFATIDVGRAICDNCREEFLIINNVPMTLEQYRKTKPQ
jgi:hypothetical protein